MLTGGQLGEGMEPGGVRVGVGVGVRKEFYYPPTANERTKSTSYQTAH